jgi:polyisoprenoid-binding protein YceI
MATEHWNIDPAHSGAYFVVRHMVVSKVRGAFTRWSGTLTVDDERPETSRVEVSIETASIDTRDAKRDAHLRSADFFDAERFPEITFRSTRVASLGRESVQVVGDLTIHGVTRSVMLDVDFLGRGKDPWGGERAGFSAKTAINRGDFGLRWNQALETGGVLVGEKVEIELEVQAVKAQQPAAAA